MAETAPSRSLPSQPGWLGRWEWLRRLAQRIRHRPEPGRDLHLDFLRGWCIFSMVVDHAAGERQSLLFGVTGNGPWPLTGAHGFVMLSGTVMGILYRRVMAREGVRAALDKLGRRAFKLYLVAVALGLFDIAWGFVPWQKDRLSAVSWDAIWPILALKSGDDLMTFYVTLMVLAAPALLLLRRRLWWALLAASVAAWLVHQFNERWLNPPTTYFVPVADWQLLFMAGLLIGYHRAQVSAFLTGARRVAFLVLLLGTFAFLLGIQFLVNTGVLSDPPEWVSRFATDAWQGYDHNPPAHMLTLFVYMLSLHRLTAWLWLPLQRGIGWFLIPLGQSALYVYAVHAVLVFYVLESLGRFKALEGWPLTVALLGLMLLLWVMVKRRFLFWLIPR